MKKLLSLLLVILFVVTPTTVAASSYNKSPSGVTTVNTSLPKTTQKVKEINELLSHKQNRVQLAVLGVDKLHDESIEDLGLETARNWKIGYEDSNYGMLFVFATKDRKMRIETSNNMATIITDLEANHYMDIVKPYFKDGKFDEGTVAMLDKIYQDKLLPLANGEDIKNIEDDFLNIPMSTIIFGGLGLAAIFGGIFFLLNRKAAKIIKKFDSNKNYVPTTLEQWILMTYIIDEAQNHKPYADYCPKWSSSYSSSGKSSSSSWSNDSWSGGGFDGGGSSSSW